MAGAFASMTSAAWAEGLAEPIPWFSMWVAETGAMRGIVELGFALSVGVLLDTLVVRPILVPAFLALRISKTAEASD